MTGAAANPVLKARELGGRTGASGISNAYSQPPNWDLIFVASGGKLCRERETKAREKSDNFINLRGVLLGM